MDKPSSVAELTELGRVRLSEHFYMREMLYSEVANFHGLANIPDDPDLAIAAGRELSENVLEPLHRAFGHVTIRSAFRSRAVNGFCHDKHEALVASGQVDHAYYCANNDYNRARHGWDQRDDDGFMGATASVVIPWYLPQFEKTGDARPLAWWIKDHIPAYAQVMFFPWMCAFNIRWYEGPSAKPIQIDDGGPGDLIVLTDTSMANFDEDHSAAYAGFPTP